MGTFKTHGMTGTAEHRAWKNMRMRCLCKNTKHYHRYGGRGITVCKEWDESFERFYADMGPRPSPKHTLDRIDNEKGYCKENCRWATRFEQSQNTSQTRLITFNGITLSFSEWARRAGIDNKALTKRLRNGWPLELALTMKPDANRRINTVVQPIVQPNIDIGENNSLFKGIVEPTNGFLNTRALVQFQPGVIEES